MIVLIKYQREIIMFELTTEKKLGHLLMELNELRKKYDVTYETFEEIVSVMGKFSWEQNMMPSVHRIEDAEIPGCGNCTHLWDEDACLGTTDGPACLKWIYNSSEQSITEEVE